MQKLCPGSVGDSQDVCDAPFFSKTARSQNKTHQHITNMKSLIPSPLFNNDAARSLARRGCSLFDRKKQRTGIETLEARTVPAIIFPTVSFDAPSEALIGDTFTFVVNVDPHASVIGYGPYIDLLLDSTGIDGVGPNGVGPNEHDGITLLSATAFGIDLMPTAKYDRVPLSGSTMTDGNGVAISTAGFASYDQVVTLDLPFGSFVPGQPTIPVSVTVKVHQFADVGVALPIAVYGGFKYGETALDDPSSDSPDAGSRVDDLVKPALFTISKTYIGPEGETATGPNFKKSFDLNVKVAPGQTLTSFNLVDNLPNTMAFLSATPGAGAPIIPPTAAHTQGATVTGNWATLTGSGSYGIDFYVPMTNAAGGGTHIIAPTTGQSVTLANDAQGSGSWIPLDPRDRGVNPIVVSSDATAVDATVIARSLAVQKGVDPIPVINVGPVGYSPGDVVKYTIDVQVSDYFAFGDLLLTDTLSDGLRYYTDSTHFPTLQVNGNGFTYATAAFGKPGAVSTMLRSDNNLTTTATDGSTIIKFDVSSELAHQSNLPNSTIVGGGKLIGGLVDRTNGAYLTGTGNLGDSGTTAKVTFYAQIQDKFTDTAPSGDRSVDHGDLLRNTVTANARLIPLNTLPGAVGSVNLLSDPGFESLPLTSVGNVITNFTPGLWAAEQGSITTTINGVTPFTNPNMLRLTNDGGVTTQAFQAVNLSSFGPLIGTGTAMVNLNSFFNVGSINGNIPPAPSAAIVVSFYSNNNAASLLPGGGGSALVLDTATNTWEAISASVPIPAATQWMIAQVYYGNAALAGQPGFVDEAKANITQQFDDSAANIPIAHGELRKTIYAINGNTTFTSPPSVNPGDTITYRLEYDLPNTDSDGLVLKDYLPLPIFDVSSSLTFLTTPTTLTIPLAGEAVFVPNAFTGKFPNTIPVVIPPTGGNNMVEFHFNANFPDNGNPTANGAFDLDNTVNGTDALTTKIDILFTVTATHAPFADGLYLTNLAHSTEEPTNAGNIDQNAIVQVRINEPNVVIRKGVIDTNSPSEEFNASTHLPSGVTFNNGLLASGTINSTTLAGGKLTSGVSGVDANDLVTFAITLENVGNGAAGAFDIALKEALPAGFQIPSSGLNALNLKVFGGANGNPTFTDIDPSNPGLFAGGIQFTDSSTGALSAYSPTSGKNIIIVTYNLQVVRNDNVTACQELPNTVTLCNFTNKDGGIDFTPTDKTASALTTIRCLELTKSVATTSESHTGFKGGFEQVTIGEIVRYRLAVELPEGGTQRFQLLDHLPAGISYLPGNDKLAIVSTIPMTGAPAGSSNSSLNIITNWATITGSATGQNVSFNNLGAYVNNDNDAGKEYVVVEFNALVQNVVANQAGTKLSNTFEARKYIGDSVETVSYGDPSAPLEVCVVEPRLFNFGKTADVAMGDAGDSVPFTLSFTAGNGPLDTAAFDVRLTDNLAPYFNLNSVLVKRNGVVLSSGFSNLSAGGVADVSIDRVNPGDHIEVTLKTTVSNQVAPCQNIENEAHFSYTSLPGAKGTIPNPTGGTTPGNSGAANGERNGMDGIGGLNNYVGEACTTFSVNCPTITKTIVKTSDKFSKFGQFDPKITDLLHGEIITYRVSFILPEGSSPDTVLTDVLPYGAVGELALISAKVLPNGIGSGIVAVPLNGGPNLTVPSAALSDANANGFLDTATFDFGDLTVSGVSPSSRTITVEVKAQVTAASANIPGKLLTNTATLSTAYGSATATADAEVITKFTNGGPFGQINHDIDRGTFTLDVEGTPLGDTIAVKADPVSGLTSLIVNGTNYIYPANISRINVFGGDGNDTISADKALTIPVYFNGGNGNDNLTGGAAADMLLGGEGNDAIDGGDGADVIIGGGGSDKLRGSSGWDILIAARTAFDGNWQALDAISKAWASESSDYGSKIAQLTEGVGNARQFKLHGSSITPDEGRNSLDGGADLDWFIAASAPRDRIIGKTAEEVVTTGGEGLRSLVSTKLLRAMVAR